MTLFSKLRYVEVDQLTLCAFFTRTRANLPDLNLGQAHERREGRSSASKMLTSLGWDKIYMRQALGFFFLPNLAISVRLASVSVGLASVLASV